MHSVTVLMSTYNGEKYLREQIDSLIRQRDIDLKICIRDDGSTDSTIEIINEYIMKYNYISLEKGTNVGIAKSFFALCKMAIESDFYAFCDQDDVWDDDKLICAINKIKAIGEDMDSQPILYYSNMRVVDEDLSFLRMTYDKKRIPIPKTKYSGLAEIMSSGNTFVFNDALRDIINKKTPGFCSMHDSYIFPIACLFGKTVFDETAHISYRQHHANVSGTRSGKKNLVHYLKRFIQMNEKRDEPRYNNAKSILDCYADIMSKEDVKELKKITEYKDGLLKKLALIFDRNIKGTTLMRDLSIRYKILIENF